MAQMSVAVQTMIDRLEVDLQGDKIAASLCIFDVTAWCSDSGSEHEMLKTHVSTLAHALKQPSPQKIVEDFAFVGLRLQKLYQTAQKQNLEVSNRLAWSWVLVPEWRVKYLSRGFQLSAGLEFLITFYLSVKTGTTHLERNLGKLLEQMKAHCGPTAQDGSSMSALAEVSETEQELFRRVDSEGSSQLVPTKFGHACASMWITCFGRRFRYKYDSQTTPGSAGQKSTGSLAAAHRNRNEATKVLGEGSGSDVQSFVPGLSLPLPASGVESQALRGTRWGGNVDSAPKKGKKTPLQNFQEHTMRKKQSNRVAINAVGLLLKF